MSKRWMVRTVVAATVVLAALIVVSACSSDDSGSGTGTGADATSLVGVAEVSERLAGIPQNGNVLGESAVTIVEYGDLQCPFCAQASAEVTPVLIDEFVRTGDAQLEFRSVAFLGADSETGALAAQAAGRQDGTWSFVEVLYANQGDENSGWLDEDIVREAAAATGLDLAQFDQDFQSDEIVNELFENDRQWRADGGTGTPHYVVTGPNGMRVVPAGASTADFRAAVAEVS